MLDAKVEIMFKLVNESFENRVSVDMLAQIYVIHTSSA